MKLTQKLLKQIIKEELGEVMDKGAKIQEYLQEIAWWMEENGMYNPEEGVLAWLKLNNEDEDAEEVSPEIRQALIDMSEDIYDFLDQ